MRCDVESKYVREGIYVNNKRNKERKDDVDDKVRDNVSKK